MGKKILTVLILGALIMISAVPTMAGSIYGEFTLFGAWEREKPKSSLDGDCSQLTFGLKCPLHQFMFGAELSTGSIGAPRSYAENDFSFFKIKGGPFLLNYDQTQLIATLGYSKINLDGFDLVISGWMLGMDLLSALDEQSDLEVDFAFSLKGDYAYTCRKESKSRDCSILDLKIKLVHYLQSNLAATVGYSYSSVTLDFPTEPSYKFSGLSLGLKYVF